VLLDTRSAFAPSWLDNWGAAISLYMASTKDNDQISVWPKIKNANASEVEQVQGGQVSERN
jgi:hypothetical protein